MHRVSDKTKIVKVAGNFFRALTFITLVAAFPTVGRSLTLAWTPNTNPAVVGFKIHYGSASRVYTRVLAVDNMTTSTAINALVAGATYYLSVTTCDAVGNESPFSDEITYTVPVPAALPLSNSSPTQSVIPPVAATTQPTTTQPTTTQPTTTQPTTTQPTTTQLTTTQLTTTQLTTTQSPTTQAASSPVARAVSAKKVTNSGPGQTAANPTATLSPEPTNPGPTSPAAQIAVVAKAKCVSATVAAPPTTEKSNSTNPLPIARTDSPVSVATNIPTNTNKSELPGLAATQADTVVNRAAQLYAAVSPFDVDGDGQLDASEQIALVDAILHDALPLIGNNPNGSLALSEASEVSLWIVVVHQQIARFDVNGDGKLLGAEQAALAAALETDDKLLPIFAPLMIESVSSH